MFYVLLVYINDVEGEDHRDVRDRVPAMDLQP